MHFFILTFQTMGSFRNGVFGFIAFCWLAAADLLFALQNRNSPHSPKFSSLQVALFKARDLDQVASAWLGAHWEASGENYRGSESELRPLHMLCTVLMGQAGAQLFSWLLQNARFVSTELGLGIKT